jgi:hypothetical protein
MHRFVANLKEKCKVLILPVRKIAWHGRNE